MAFILTPEQQEFKQLATQFAENEIAPFAAQWDRDSHFPAATLKKAAELGFAGLYCEPRFGGSGLTRMDAVVIFQALAQACVSTTAYLTVHNMVTWLIDQFAAKPLKEKWMPALCRMDIFGSYCLTEPDAGSDAASLATTAEKTDAGWRLNGSKAFISGGGNSDIYVCMAKTDPAADAISCFLVEKDRKGISFGQQEKKLGWHSQPTSMVFFENCEIPDENRIGELGQGFKIALSALNGGRINIAACSLGGAQACLSAAQKHLNERVQFGKTLATFQALQFRFADLYTDLQAAQLMTYHAAHSLDQQSVNAITDCAMAKRYTTDVCFNISDQALQLHGGYGYLQDHPIERYFRDLRVHQILEGTNEIMRLIIARQILHPDFSIA